MLAFLKTKCFSHLSELTNSDLSGCSFNQSSLNALANLPNLILSIESEKLTTSDISTCSNGINKDGLDASHDQVAIRNQQNCKVLTINFTIAPNYIK